MAQLAVEAIEVGMVGGVLLIGEDELTVDHLCITKHVLLLRNQLLPVVDTRLTDICHHDATFRCTIVGIEIDLVAFAVDRAVLIVHVRGHLDELRLRLSQVAHEEVVA